MREKPTIDPRYTGVPALTQPDAGTRPLDTDASRAVAGLELRLPEGRPVRLDCLTQIGQSDSNRIVLRDERVSRRHCAIRVVNGRTVVNDLGSTNGTFVNGARVREAELNERDVLSVGPVALVVNASDGAGGAGPEALVGNAPAILELRERIARLAPSRLPVLILGETGTGKELVAERLHARSGRRGPYVRINCGGIPRDLVESVLFGHERGAFTGAVGKHVGVFLQADGGTLFLDEIGELPLGLQPRLLRALETGWVRPVGATREVKVQVRVLAATHVDLKAAVADGLFRPDLFFRLAVLELSTPPLRERRGDIALLARHILDQHAENARACRLTRDAIDLMERHPWPGNVRELRNTLCRAVALGHTILDAHCLELAPAPAAVSTRASVCIEGRRYQEIERDVLAHALERCQGSRRAAAAALDIPKSTLCDKARMYGLVTK